jgi:hypothetical protein
MGLSYVVLGAVICLVAPAIWNETVSAATLDAADAAFADLRQVRPSPGRPDRPLLIHAYRTPTPIPWASRAAGGDPLSAFGFYFEPLSSGAEFGGRLDPRRYGSVTSERATQDELAASGIGVSDLAHVDAAPVPVPAGWWMFGSGVAALACSLGRRRQPALAVTEPAAPTCRDFTRVMSPLFAEVS